MFRLIFLFVVLGAGIFAGTHYAGQQGYVLISIADKTIEMSVTTLVIFLVATLAILFIAETLLKKLFRSSSATWRWFTIRKVKRSRQDANEGIIKLLEGQWKVAEKKITRRVSHHDMPLLCYLMASEAAVEMGDKTKRDRYLQLARKEDNSSLAVSLTLARQQIREGELKQARETLSNLYSDHNTNPLVLNLLKSVYLRLKQWQALLEIIPQLSKAKVIDNQQQLDLQVQAHSGMLSNIASTQGTEQLIHYWDKLNRKVKSDSTLIVHVTELLIQKQAYSEAFTIAKEALKKQTIDGLLLLLPNIELADNHPIKQLLEETLTKDPNQAEALSALSRIEITNQQWSKAQQLLEKALSIRTSYQDYLLLAQALEKQNLTQASNEVAKKAESLLKQA
ncbi:heme biosynthesis protein HemY [Vibrio sp. S4M6]|uniref:heme biosynthesis HemY N-terminal domain-containing protein n=1 Tax=Vibrio sinus TaxID=2946865 RepID=UPI00202A35E8|nr:heme biosynthesis HemY N-terminal domain-containing protein [Vibrio sinus]MCL9783542.1 heme biosynthesis protein HemY [Vibrio sinus]